jgi:hypothetical protein
MPGVLFNTTPSPNTWDCGERSCNNSQILSMYTNEKHNNWSKYVKLIQYAMKKVINESTKMTPHYLVFGSEPQMPIDVNFDLPFEHKSNLELIENLHKARETCKSYLNKMRE